jgi:hypothetical protein
MGIIVQKFGGTSVANAEKIQAAARRAIRAQQDGHQVVMVVSAMGHQTDYLVDLAKQICDDPPAREMDMLLSTGEQVSVALMAMAINELGSKAVSLTGGQIGIKTDSSHGKARIQSISTERMLKHLEAAASSSPRVSRASTKTSTSRRSAVAAATPLPWHLPRYCVQTLVRFIPMSTACSRPIRGSLPKLARWTR